MRRPRHLSPEERALWDRVAERTTPMEQIPRAPIARSQEKAPPAQRAGIGEFRIGQKSAKEPKHDLLPGVSDRLARAPVNMDHKSFSKMKRGKLSPQAKIDLHGMTLAEAHPELIDFIHRSYTRGFRLVLVITGKGKDRDDGSVIPTRLGVLRHQVPQWLALTPIAPMVLQVTPAHVKHGGQGAYYVYLRRAR